jgi:hypothetical protein
MTPAALHENMTMHLICTHGRTLGAVTGRTYDDLKAEHDALTCPPRAGEAVGPVCAYWAEEDAPLCGHGSCYTITEENGDPYAGFSPPCPGCESTGDCAPGCDYAAWCAAMEADYAERGELAGSPREMECYDCGRAARAAGQAPAADGHGLAYVMRKVTGFGPVAEARRDPSTTYRLECGHTAM